MCIIRIFTCHFWPLSPSAVEEDEDEDGHTVVATARGIFNSNGGVLSSIETGVSIIIPQGAIPEGIEQEIYFKVCRDNSILPPLDKEKGTCAYCLCHCDNSSAECCPKCARCWQWQLQGYASWEPPNVLGQVQHFLGQHRASDMSFLQRRGHWHMVGGAQRRHSGLLHRILLLSVWNKKICHMTTRLLFVWPNQICQLFYLKIV